MSFVVHEVLSSVFVHVDLYYLTQGKLKPRLRLGHTLSGQYIEENDPFVSWVDHSNAWQVAMMLESGGTVGLAHPSKLGSSSRPETVRLLGARR